MERGMMMRRGYDEIGEIKKGPWKAEEDEVLINHVKRYGPRDWSSIRSKGFLQRTGKSCRLRWVNKLRPNLKNGVKFSAEEERVVIELQGEFGNKWARIATYLPGRTDNDVKNFWSSRQKRLARILQNPPPPPPPPPPPQPKSHKNPKTAPSLHLDPTLEAPKLSSSPDCDAESSSNIENAAPINMLPLPEFMNPPGLFNFDPSLIQLEFLPMEKTVNTDPQQPQLSFPPIPPLQTDLPLPLESHELFTRLGDPNFFSVFGQVNASDIGQLPYASPGTKYEAMIADIETERSTGNGGRGGEIENPATPDSFIDDFPIDMFDHIEPLPSPSDW